MCTKMLQPAVEARRAGTERERVFDRRKCSGVRQLDQYGVCWGE